RRPRVSSLRFAAVPVASFATTITITITTIVSATRIDPSSWRGAMRSRSTSLAPAEEVPGRRQPRQGEQHEHGRAEDRQQAAEAVPPADHGHLQGEDDEQQ